MIVKSIKSKQTYDWLMHKHYLKRIPPISFAFGLFIDDYLEGVCTFGIPASFSLCVGVCGERYKHLVFELNRLCANESIAKNSLSFFVSKCLKMLPTPKIVVSYADISQGHHGYIYQATNWIYTGLSAKRTDSQIIGEENNGKHARHLFDKYGGIGSTKAKYPEKVTSIERPRKHRYFYFIGTHKEKKQLLKALNYDAQPYPKGQNMRYDASYTAKTQIEMFNAVQDSRENRSDTIGESLGQYQSTALNNNREKRECMIER